MTKWEVAVGIMVQVPRFQLGLLYTKAKTWGNLGARLKSKVGILGDKSPIPMKETVTYIMEKEAHTYFTKFKESEETKEKLERDL